MQDHERFGFRLACLQHHKINPAHRKLMPNDLKVTVCWSINYVKSWRWPSSHIFENVIVCKELQTVEICKELLKKWAMLVLIETVLRMLMQHANMMIEAAGWSGELTGLY